MHTNIHRNYTEKKTNYIFILPLLLILVSSSIYSCSKKKKIEPQILQVSPDVVWSGEDNQVEIFGKNFIEGAKLNIKEDKKEASIFSVYLLGEAGKIDVPFSKESEEKVKAVIKKGTTPGNYRIFVEIGNKQKASYPIKVLRLPTPYIEKISRDKISNISDQTIILEGKNFQEITKVYIGDKEAEFSFSETQVVIKIPPDFPAGDYEIKVVNSEGSYALYSKISVVEGAKIEYKVQKPQNIFANSNTQFSVQITNKGKVKANIKISLNIDGNTKQIQTEISPEETKEVNFDVFVSANLEFELIIEGEDELGGVFSISSKETMIANCSPEICDGKDNDCNGLVDDGVLITFYKDNDGDGYGDPNNSIQACSQPPQYVQNSDDCNDNNNLINPNTTWFKDYDGDGFTDGTTQISCPQPTGYVLNAIPGDCNDNNSNINPNTTWFKDADGDGFTDGTFQVSCVQPAGFVLYAPGGDCDDSDSARNPGQSEICDGKDNNCDGQIDEGVKLTFYEDQDGDGYGNANNPTQACLQPGGYVQNPFDCNDNNASIYPGAPLNCSNGQDNDCSGQVETWFWQDGDGDTFTTSVSQCANSMPSGFTSTYNPLDCDDGNASINPNTTWFKDADFDGFYPAGGSSVSCNNPFSPNNATYVAIPGGDCDDNNANLNPNTTWFKDADFDGFYPVGGSQVSCNNPFAPNNATYVAIPAGDCNDNNASIYPGAPLNCNNGQDNDCSGNIETWAYTDQDGDRYAPNNSSSCVDTVVFPGKITAGQELGTNDCDDNNSSIYPGAPLNCNNGQDNDCSGNIETWAYTDQDGDKYAPNNVSSCVDVVNFPGKITAGQELGYNDCNDNDVSVYPGAPLNCNNGQDNDCSGNVEKWAYTDQDGDLYAPNNVSSCVDVVNFPGKITAGQELGYNDCNDNNALIYPGALLNCNNGQDNDCSGNVEKWAYTDQDGDLYAPNNVSSCVDVVNFPGKITAGQELGYNDCNDTNSSIYPGAPLNCNNGQDNDCSGNIEKWAYTDVDGDKYAPNSTSSCIDVVNFPGKITAGQELGTNDCNDNNSAINPGASEVCNGIDDNCNGQADEELASCGIPTCPTTISAQSFFKSSTGDVSISLSWNDPATNESGFVIEKSKSPNFSPSVSFVINAPNTTSYTLDFQEPLTQFYFRVYAFNPTGSCTPIATASTYTPPGLLWAFSLTGAPQDANDFAVNPKMFDINGDGKKEIIIADNQGYVYAISTVEYNFQISSIPLWISRPGGNVEISTPAIAVYQGNPTVVVSNQGNKKIHILGKDGNLIRTITLTQTPYPPIITDFNGDLLPDILFSIGDGGLVAYSFSGDQIFSVPAPGGEKFFFPSIFEYKGSSTYIVLGTNQKRIKGFSGNTEILNVDLQELPFSFISTFKIGNLSHAAFSTEDGFLHIIRLVKNPLIKFNTNQNVVAKPLFYDFNNDGTPDIAINSGQTLFFIDGKTGNQMCQFNLGLQPSYSSPALLTDTVSVVVGTDGGQIYAIKPDCTQRWSYPSAGFQIRSSPLVADIDKDGAIEIVVGAESAAAGKIIILKSDGNLEREIVSLEPIRSSPKIGDINGDGIYEVVIGTDQIPLLTTGGVLILNCPTDCASSYNLTSYTATGWGKVKTTPLLYDLNSDGFLDIVFADENQKLYALSGTSINYSQPYLLWSANFAGVGQMAPGVIFPSSPTLFIKSGIPYIAIGSNGKGLYIVNGSNGSLAQQLLSGEKCFSSPATFDYNKDGVGDIVIGCDDKNVYFVSGTDYSTMRIEKKGGNIRGSPAIYDIDQDGFEDVGIGSDDNNLYVFNGVKIHLCSTNLGINFDNQPAFYKNKIVVSSDLNSYVISATDCSQISSIPGIAPSFGASFGVYMENNSPRLVVGTGNKIFVFDESFSQIYPFPFTYSGGSNASSPVLGDIDGDGSLELSVAFVKGAAGTIFAYRITRDVDFGLEWGEFAHDRYNSSFSEQKENSYFSPRYISKPPDTENIYLTQEHKEKSAVGCSSFRETALLFLFFTLFIVRRKILFSRNQNLKRWKNLWINGEKLRLK